MDRLTRRIKDAPAAPQMNDASTPLEDIRAALDPNLVLEHTTDCVVVYDLQWRIRYLNSRARALMEVHGTVQGRILWEAFPAMQGTPLWQHFHHAVESGKPVEFREHIPDYDGWFELHAYPSCAGLTVFFRDVTEEQLRSGLLAGLQERMERMVAVSPDLMVWVDREGRFLEVNPASVAALGYQPHELVGEHMQKVILPDDLAAATGVLESVIQGTTLADFECRHIRRDGSTAVLSWSSVWLETDGCAFAIARDISRRSQMEEDLRRSEERYRLLFEDNPQAMWVFDADTARFLAVNRAAIRQYGYTLGEFLGMSVFELIPESRRPYFAALLKSSQGPSRQSIWVHLRKDGTPLYVEGTSHAVDFFGRQARLVLANDITERRALEEQFRQAQKMEAVGLLAGGVAHDFNNLLTIINGFSELNLRRHDLPEGLKRDLEQIRNAGQRAASLTGQLLAFSRKQMMQPRTLNLIELIRDLRPMIEHVLSSGIELRLNLDTRLDTVYADPVQIEQLLLNLIINAKDAMEGRGFLTIETANTFLDQSYCSRHAEIIPGRYTLVSISDTGQGMSPETQARIFEPFFTTKKKGSGTGLGLPTAYGIARQHGGHIAVYSELGVGSTFKLYLPVTTASTEQPAFSGGTEAAPPPRRPPETRSETILLVEDDDGVREFAMVVLKEQGYRVIAVKAAAEALFESERLAAPLDLLLTDVVLPGTNGRELAEFLASLRPSMKVLFVSGYTENAIVHRGVLDPGLAFLSKPFTGDELAAKVRSVLDAPERQPVILLVEADADRQSLLREALHKAGYDVVTVADAAQLRSHTNRSALDLAIVPLVPGASGIEAIRSIRELWPHQKILALSESSSATQDRVGVFLGVTRVITRPQDSEQLIHAVHALIG